MLRKFLILFLCVGAASLSAADTPPSIPAYPAGTFIIARLKSMDALQKGVENLKSWTKGHASVQSLFDDQWETVEKFDLKAAAAAHLQISQKEFDDYFECAITLYIGDDFKWAQKSKMLPTVFEMTASSPEKAQDFLEMLRGEGNVTKAEKAAEGIEHMQLSSDDEKKEPVDIYAATVDSRIIFGNSLDFTIAAQKAASSTILSATAFWNKVEAADIAVWVDTRVLVNLLKEKMEERGKENERAMISAELLDKLGLNEIEGVGIAANFEGAQIKAELMYAPNATGVAKIFGCPPVGLEPTPLIPSDAKEFTMGRTDVACLWSEIRRIAKIAMSATDTMYTGWQKQIKDTYGVDIERQLFGSFGDRYFIFNRSENEPRETAIYIAVNDSVALQGGLEALFGFFSNGKSMFEKDKLAGTTVWRMKSEFQTSSAPPIAYALTPHWLIINVGDPTQIQDLIEAAENTQITNPLLERSEIKETLALPNLTSFGHRQLSDVLTDIAIAMLEAKHKKEAANQNEGEPVAIKDEEIPEFDDVEESVLIYTENVPGNVSATIRILPGE